MFTIQQIKDAHSKVKSGADFPAYIRELVKLGVTGYEVFVTDGHANYYGKDDYKTSAPAKYEAMMVAAQADTLQFKADLKSHQQGNTDYMTFCNDCAKSGIEKWMVDLQQMSCTYFDKEGNIIVVEQIPA